MYTLLILNITLDKVKSLYLKKKRKRENITKEIIQNITYQVFVMIIIIN